jgi:hypothetical protein
VKGIMKTKNSFAAAVNRPSSTYFLYEAFTGDLHSRPCTGKTLKKEPEGRSP